MATIYFALETTITDLFFDDDRSNQEFERWLNSLDDLFSIKLELQPVQFEGVNSVNLFVNSIDDDHNLTIGVSVNAGGASSVTIGSDDALISAIESELIPEFVRQFNDACDLAFPISGGSFNDFLFMNEEFYLRVFTRDYVKYESSRVSVLEFKLTGQFREEF